MITKFRTRLLHATGHKGGELNTLQIEQIQAFENDYLIVQADDRPDEDTVFEPVVSEYQIEITRTGRVAAVNPDIHVRTGQRWVYVAINQKAVPMFGANFFAIKFDDLIVQIGG